MRKIFFLIAGLLLFIYDASAQKVAVKSNLLYDAAATINLGVEFRAAPKWTVDVSANYNAWTFSGNKKWKHWIVQPEARYWLCETFNGHFFGAHMLGGHYNIGNLDLNFKMLNTDLRVLKNNRFDGWAVGAGLVYGYSWMLSRHWNIEGVLGFGYMYTVSDRYGCHECSNVTAKNVVHHYVGPTKAGINLVYTF